MRTRHLALLLVPFLATLSLVSLPAAAQSTRMGKLRITVNPKQAYVFIDGKAMRDGNQTISLTAGKHQVDVVNYGYFSNTQEADVPGGATLDLHVTLQKSGENVSGPFGDIEFKGHPRAAVLLNGTTPAYFVGHVDEFDNNFLWHQWLLVHPGKYAVTVTRHGNTIWSGPIDVKAGQRVVVYLNDNGKMKTHNFQRGLTLGPQPRFDAGIASAMVPVAPVTAQLAASQSTANCGQSATLNWSDSNAVATSITDLGNVSSSGDKSVSPTQTTTYKLVASGPGGIVTRTATIDVNAQPAAMLTLSTPEVTFQKIGDKVVTQGSATLSWTTSDGNRVTIQPLGNVSDNGSQTIQPTPDQTTAGPVNQNVTYTLKVSNACGGTATRTATLHIIGSIKPAPAVTLASVFYPTNYPVHSHPRVGLVPSQEKELAEAAATFKNHEEYAQPNKLLIVGHADVRGPAVYNMALSMRRAELVKDYLVSQGIPASEIEVRADGKRQELTEAQVKQLQARDPEAPPKWMTAHQKTTWLAYNRRVDIIREPAGQESVEAFPSDGGNARIVWERPQPAFRSFEKVVAQIPANEHQTLASNTYAK
ncbi:MAG TPA: OmpA family protein [Candidatus Aquilonibacter sp.]|nr:OmpA family protein [Candidatus Aquilonibacter sp.]